MENKYDFLKKKFLTLTWPQRIMVLLQCFLIVLFLILYAAFGRPWNSWSCFSLGVFVCAACAVSILFADNLFRWNLRFVIRDPEDAEPSDWVFFCRWVSWLALTIFALLLFIAGLTVP